MKVVSTKKFGTQEVTYTNDLNNLEYYSETDALEVATALRTALTECGWNSEITIKVETEFVL